MDVKMSVQAVHFYLRSVMMQLAHCIVLWY